jgi:hypothetical protein
MFKENLSIAEYLKSARPQAEKSDGSAYYWCPICRGNQKLELKKDGEVWYCHKCGTGGQCHVRTQKRKTTGSIRRRNYWPCGKESAQWDYLEGRGFDAHQMEELCPCFGPDPRRVYLPCYGRDRGSLRYMVGRAICDGMEPKYLYPKNGEFPDSKRSVLWGLHRFPPDREKDRLVICEGVFDAVVVPDAVALLGCSVTPQQVEILSTLGVSECTVLLDGDAYEKAVQVAVRVGRLAHTYVARLPYDLDPEDAGETLDRAMSRREQIS